VAFDKVQGAYPLKQGGTSIQVCDRSRLVHKRLALGFAYKGHTAPSWGSTTSETLHENRGNSTRFHRYAYFLAVER
jgi:hypothetical protein